MITPIKIRRIDVERTKRHMLRSTPDVIILRIPYNAEQQIDVERKFHAWVRDWGALHHCTSPFITMTPHDYTHRRYEASKG